MPFQELRDLLAQVITSWQVIAATLAVIIYCSLVSYVAELYRRPSSGRSFLKPRRQRVKRKKQGDTETEEVLDEGDDGLGLK